MTVATAIFIVCALLEGTIIANPAFVTTALAVRLDADGAAMVIAILATAQLAFTPASHPSLMALTTAVRSET